MSINLTQSNIIQYVDGSLYVTFTECFESECLAVQFNNNISSRTENKGSSDLGQSNPIDELFVLRF